VPEPTDKDALIAQLQTEHRQQKAQIKLFKQELKLQKEKIDALIRRIFGAKTEQLAAGQLELLLSQKNNLGKAEASVAPSTEANPIAKNRIKKATRHRERWPFDLPIERQYIDPEEVAADPEAYRCIGEEVSEKLDYQPARFFRRQFSPAQICLVLRSGSSTHYRSVAGDFTGTLTGRSALGYLWVNGTELQKC
jgi:hypothetical protein